MRKLTNEVDNYFSSQLRTIVNFFDYLLICNFFRFRNKNYSDNVKATPQRKLRNLGAEHDLSPCNPDHVVHNYSSVSISPRTKTLLAYGLDFCLPIFKLNYIKHFLSFEKLFSFLSNSGDVPNDNLHQLKMKLRSIAYKYYYNFKGFKIFSSTFSKRDICDLKQLASNNNIIVCKPDKGRGVVLIDRVTYTNKMINIVNDTSKFIKLTESIRTISTRIEDKINNYLRKIKKNDLPLLKPINNYAVQAQALVFFMVSQKFTNLILVFRFSSDQFLPHTTPHLITLLNILCLYYLI